MIEIERRFLLKKIPIDFKPDQIQLIEQHYLNKDLTDGVDRIRSVKEHLGVNHIKYFRTLKQNKTYMSCDEYEYEISDKDFYDLILDSQHDLKKIRYKKKINNDIWEIDVFYDISVIICEIEIPAETYELIIPDIIKDVMLMEITGMEQFSNYHLSK